jgi:hypothetical protein
MDQRLCGWNAGWLNVRIVEVFLVFVLFSIVVFFVGVCFFFIIFLFFIFSCFFLLGDGRLDVGIVFLLVVLFLRF